MRCHKSSEAFDKNGIVFIFEFSKPTFMQKKYTHIFFDFDNTLWDFSANSVASLRENFEKHQLARYFKSFETFSEIYHAHNDKLWAAYRRGEIDKQRLATYRFELSFGEAKIVDKDFAHRFAHDYLQGTTQQTTLLPYARQALQYLAEKYSLHLITNGFEEVQFPKIENSGLKPFFRTVVTSEEAGKLKPHPQIFGYALKKAAAPLAESLMIGDDWESDIQGAKNTGMDYIFFNPRQRPTPEKPQTQIVSLKALLRLL